MTPEPRFEDAARDFAAAVAASFALSGTVRAQPQPPWSPLSAL